MNRPQGTLQLPPQMSTIAPDVDHLYYLIYWVSVVSFVLITGTMLVYVLKYRRRPGVKAEPTGHSTALEIFWTFTPLFLLVYLFHQGFSVYMNMAVAPVDSIEIRVQGQQWSWAFEHPNGVVQNNEVILPVRRPIKMIMSSVDVLHSFYVPQFRIKRDVVPGMFSTVWFEATHETGDEPATLFCAEYCGAPAGITTSADRNTNHSTMLANINIVSQQRYDQFLAEGPPPPAECAGRGDNLAACWGEKIYANAGCRACHSTQAGQDRPAPSWNGIWGRTANFEGGESLTVDENYIAQSIRQPQARIVRGYASINMPPYRLSDNEVNAVIAYMKTLH
ncbi:MAG: cytochrome c oxidase subunit II [Polyangiales bacterium]